jgi:hypothetical protein
MQNRRPDGLYHLDRAVSGEIVLYRSDDRRVQVQLRSMDGTAWLTQAQLAGLFATTRANITMHLRTIFESGELDESSVCKDHLLPAAVGKQYRTCPDPPKPLGQNSRFVFDVEEYERLTVRQYAPVMAVGRAGEAPKT